MRLLRSRRRADEIIRKQGKNAQKMTLNLADIIRSTRLDPLSRGTCGTGRNDNRQHKTNLASYTHPPCGNTSVSRNEDFQLALLHRSAMLAHKLKRSVTIAIYLPVTSDISIIIVF